MFGSGSAGRLLLLAKKYPQTSLVLLTILSYVRSTKPSAILQEGTRSLKGSCGVGFCSFPLARLWLAFVQAP
jgi:hypothetical protein